MSNLIFRILRTFKTFRGFKSQLILNILYCFPVSSGRHPIQNEYTTRKALEGKTELFYTLRIILKC